MCTIVAQTSLCTTAYLQTHDLPFVGLAVDSQCFLKLSFAVTVYVECSYNHRNVSGLDWCYVAVSSGKNIWHKCLKNPRVHKYWACCGNMSEVLLTYWGQKSKIPSHSKTNNSFVVAAVRIGFIRLSCSRFLHACVMTGHETESPVKFSFIQ